MKNRVVQEKNRRPGAQTGNLNAVRHGAYSRRFGANSKQGRIVRWVEQELVSALGDPSPQETLILKRAAMKAYRCWLLEEQILDKDGEVSETLERHYLRWSRELREDLKTLGLERRAKSVQDLDAYLSENYG